MKPLENNLFSLSTETELLDNLSVSLDVGLLEVIKETAALTDQTQKAATCHDVLLVLFDVLGKMSDTVGK